MGDINGLATVVLSYDDITIEVSGFSEFVLVSVPEPGTALMLAAGLVGLAARRRRLARPTRPLGSA